MRLIPIIAERASMLMAIDEAILTAISEGKSPNTLRFYRWNPPAVSIGYFQSAKKVVNLDYLKQNKIDLVRRATGGGAVYHDQELTYSLFIDQNKLNNGDDILMSYEEICSAIITGLKTIGIDAQFSPINDLLTNSKKFSGNAQTRKHNIILQHGTILLDIDIKRMFSVLNVSEEKISDKKIEAISQRVTSLKSEGLENNFDTIMKALVKGFETKLNIKFEEFPLTDYELMLANQLEKT